MKSIQSKIHETILHDCGSPVYSRTSSGNFVDRKPSDRPVVCKDGKLRHPFYAREFGITKSLPQAIKAFGAFIL